MHTLIVNPKNLLNYRSTWLSGSLGCDQQYKPTKAGGPSLQDGAEQPASPLLPVHPVNWRLLVCQTHFATWKTSHLTTTKETKF